MKALLFKSLAALLIIWLVAIGGIRLFRGSKPRAEQVVEIVTRKDMANQSQSERTRTLDRYIERVNRLPFEERGKLHGNPDVQRFFTHLTSEEQLRLFEETLPSGMTEMMQAFNRMDAEKRHRMIEQARSRLNDMEADMQNLVGDQRNRPDEQAQVLMDKINREGLRAYLSEADAQSKLELQPLLEQLQTMMQRHRR